MGAMAPETFLTDQLDCCIISLATYAAPWKVERQDTTERPSTDDLGWHHVHPCFPRPTFSRLLLAHLPLR